LAEYLQPAGTVEALATVVTGALTAPVAEPKDEILVAGKPLWLVSGCCVATAAGYESPHHNFELPSCATVLGFQQGLQLLCVDI